MKSIITPPIFMTAVHFPALLRDFVLSLLSSWLLYDTKLGFRVVFPFLSAGAGNLGSSGLPEWCRFHFQYRVSDYFLFPAPFLFAPIGGYRPVPFVDPVLVGLSRVLVLLAWLFLVLFLLVCLLLSLSPLLVK